ncbi:Hypp3706 [Branchiostoma lanceolatum]|uniref:Hypp3706 protein n=1 Tax=Branchiostoma lanceolatum TaxID=7740 RepID=A0A8K0EYF4_BRALA|nr:Hypp3706 [Branchiostoma lanceolatum]
MSSVNCPVYRLRLTPTANARQPSRTYLTQWKLKHIIFFTCLLIVAFMPSVVSAAKTCRAWQYLDGEQCKSCSNRGCEPGQRILQRCGSGRDVVCEDCSPLAEGYTCEKGVERTCVLCDVQGKKTVRACNRFSQTVCGGCLEGFFAQATSWGKVNCIHCDFDKTNNTDCPAKVVLEKPSGKQDPGASEEVSQQQTHLQSPAMYAMVAMSVTFGAVMLLLLITAVLSTRFGLWQKIKDQLKRRHSPQLSDSFDPENGSGTCTSKRDAPEARETHGVNSTENHREPDVGYHQGHFVAHPASAAVLAIPDYPWPVPDSIEGNSNAHQKLLDKSDKSKELEGTSSPFRITDDEILEDVFVFPGPEVIRKDSESSEGLPSSPVVVLAGQTAQVHKSTKKTPGSNQTANAYRTKLAKYIHRAYEIPLRHDWFNFDRQQHLSAKLDQIPPAASLPNWRTFFETLGHLEKLDMDSVNNARVESPTLALFNVLETRNFMNMLTVGHVLEALDKTKFTGLVDYLCDEIMNTDFSEHTQIEVDEGTIS